jgi:hypothetical protein
MMQKIEIKSKIYSIEVGYGQPRSQDFDLRSRFFSQRESNRSGDQNPGNEVGLW